MARPVEHHNNRPISSLNDLPTELLSHIISCIDLHQYERVLGHIPDDPPPNRPDPYLIRDFLTKSSAFCNLSLTSRRFRDLAQKHIFFAPVLGGIASQDTKPQVPYCPRVAYFLRTLLARPDLANCVRQLRLYFSNDGQHHDRTYTLDSNMNIEEIDNKYYITIDFLKTAASSYLPEIFQKALGTREAVKSRYHMLGWLLGLLPRLEFLSVSESTFSPRDGSTDLIGVRPCAPITVDFDYFSKLQCLPAVHSLRRVKACSLFPLRLDKLDVFPNLDSLDMSVALARFSVPYVRRYEQLYEDPQARKSFAHIRHLRLDCQVKSAGIWDSVARINMGHILKGFSNLSSLEFYAEPSCEKNPFRSVRAFPQYQTNIQTYPDEPTAAEADSTLQSQEWDERVYDARTEWTDYQFLVDSLINLRTHLETLKLPGGFWTLPGGMRKPLPRFELFPQLRNLVLPQAAILSIKLDNMRFPEIVHGDFDLLPGSVLPPKLQHLKIFDAGIELLESSWLQQLFDEQAVCNQWPDLQKLEIMFGPTFKDDDLKSLIERKRWSEFWDKADKAAFEVLVDRDDDVPSVSI